ncbi:MAG: DMT family transporter [Clostridiales bacterium]|nr:DMT family transporter [Clostridiales bacterium]
MKLNKYFYLIVLGVFSISLSPIITKTASSSSITIASNRMLYTVVLLTPFTIKSILAEIKTLNSKIILLNILSGFFLAIHFWSWIDSLQHTSVANSTILVNLHPVFILLIARVFLKEKIDSISIISTLIALSGSMLIIYNSLFNLSIHPRGDIMAIIGALTVSVYLTIGASIRKDISTKSYTYITYSIAFITLFVISLFIKTNVFNYPLSDALVFLGLAIIPTLLGHSLFNMSLKYIKPHIISMAILGEPILATIWAYLLFQESINIFQLIGGFMIIAALLVKLKSARNSN